MIARINDNAYSIDVPSDEFGVSNSFNVADLTPYFGDGLAASSTTPFQGGRMMRTSVALIRFLQLKMLLFKTNQMN